MLRAGLAALLVSCAVACHDSGDTFGPPRPLHDRDTVIVSNGTEPKAIDPGIADEASGIEIAQNCFEGLTAFDAKHPLAPAPGIAKSWEVDDGGRRYVFHLRDAVWSDGHPVTADDFVWSWRRVLEPATASEYAYQLWYVQGAKAFNDGKTSDPSTIGVRALDAKTLEVRLDKPTPFFLFLTSFATLAPVPRWAVEKWDIHWTRPEHIVVDGPFTVTKWRLQDEIELRKNPRYWDAAHVVVKRIVAISDDNDDSVLNLYRTGDVDTTEPESSLPLASIPSVRHSRDYSAYPYLSSYWYWFNVRRPPFDKLEVRQAFARAVDKEKLVHSVLSDVPVASWSLVPDLFGNLTGYRPPVTKDDRYDPEGAKALLAKAGYPGGKGFPTVRLMFNPSDEHRLIAEALQAMWKQTLNVNVEIPNVEWKVMLSEMHEGNFDMARSGWQADYPEPSTFLTVFLSDSGQNDAGWKNAEYDRTLEAAMSETDPVKRNELYAKCERILMDELPVIPIYTYTKNALRNVELEGMTPNPMGEYPFKALHWAE